MESHTRRCPRSTARHFLPHLVLLVTISLAAGSSWLESAGATPPASGRIETTQTSEYSHVKSDFLCRACVALGETFFEDVLPSTKRRYPSLGGVGATAGEGAHRRPTASAPPTLQRRREQMIAEIHEAIDDLCDTLNKSLERQVRDAMETVTTGADPVAAQLQDPLVASADLREGVAIACPSALEEMAEELASVAFEALLPGKSARASTQGSGASGAVGEAARDDQASVTRAYRLPTAGTFCEDVGLCSAYVHYDITSDAVVRRRAREGRAARRHGINDGDDKAPTSSTPPSSTTTTVSEGTRGGSETSGKGRPNTTSERRGGKKAAKKAAAAENFRLLTEEAEETLRETLQRALQLRTWRQLWNAVNKTEVRSFSYWVSGLAILADPALRFHMQGLKPFAALYLGAMASLLAFALLFVFLCRRRSHVATTPTADPSHTGQTVPSERRPKQPPSPPEQQQQKKQA